MTIIVKRATQTVRVDMSRPPPVPPSRDDVRSVRCPACRALPGNGAGLGHFANEVVTPDRTGQRANSTVIGNRRNTRGTPNVSVALSADGGGGRCANT
jgi:hypothetical protein